MFNSYLVYVAKIFVSREGKKLKKKKKVQKGPRRDENLVMKKEWESKMGANGASKITTPACRGGGEKFSSDVGVC